MQVKDAIGTEQNVTL